IAYVRRFQDQAHLGCTSFFSFETAGDTMGGAPVSVCAESTAAGVVCVSAVSVALAATCLTSWMSFPVDLGSSRLLSIAAWRSSSVSLRSSYSFMHDGGRFRKNAELANRLATAMYFSAVSWLK